MMFHHYRAACMRWKNELLFEAFFLHYLKKGTSGRRPLGPGNQLALVDLGEGRCRFLLSSESGVAGLSSFLVKRGVGEGGEVVDGRFYHSSTSIRKVVRRFRFSSLPWWFIIHGNKDQDRIGPWKTPSRADQRPPKLYGGGEKSFNSVIAAAEES